MEHRIPIHARYEQRLAVGGTLGAGAPTIDLTVHFREIPHDPPLRGDDWLLVRFRTRCAREGFAEEDGEIWSRDGRLLAQSRQLALLI